MGLDGADPLHIRFVRPAPGRKTFGFLAILAVVTLGLLFVPLSHGWVALPPVRYAAGIFGVLLTPLTLAWAVMRNLTGPQRVDLSEAGIDDPGAADHVVPWSKIRAIRVVGIEREDKSIDPIAVRLATFVPEQRFKSRLAAFKATGYPAPARASFLSIDLDGASDRGAVLSAIRVMLLQFARKPDDLAAMTVNERLASLGLLNQWDRAVQQADRTKMLALIASAKVSDPEAVIRAALRAP